ncbi:helix-turn-helix domain-containing protein [Thermogemmatispora sp.]|uniref:helix-turn-helix domain-containing protein n=1 Tax=Thermogemmatispora sp. TaxID=1968838 RepID=UPI0035E3FC07
MARYTLDQLLEELGWSVSDLSHQTRLARATISRVLSGEPVRKATVLKILRAINDERRKSNLGTVRLADLDGVVLR